MRISRKTKARLERIALLLGVSLKDALEYAVGVAEKQLDSYRGDLDLFARILSDRRGSGYRDTSTRVDEVVVETLLREYKSVKRDHR